MDNSPLRTLPPEIRNYVYELALQNNGRDYLVSWSRQRTAFVICDKDNREPLALTQTCRSIRQETCRTFFAINCFTFILFRPGTATSEVSTFQTLIGKGNAHAMRQIKIFTDVVACRCDPAKSLVCTTCSNLLSDLKTVYDWSLARDIAVHLALKTRGWTLHWIRVDLGHVCTSSKANAPCYMSEYAEAYLEGRRFGRWEEYEELTGLDRPDEDAL